MSDLATLAAELSTPDHTVTIEELDQVLNDRLDLDDCRPAEWLVVFNRTGRSWMARWLSFGRYRHVSAFGKLPDEKHWLVHEVRPSETALFVIPDEHFNAKLAVAIQNSLVVKMPRQPHGQRRARLRTGWWCVPATAHLLGIRSWALRPDRLLRDCLAQGGVIVCGE